MLALFNSQLQMSEFGGENVFGDPRKYLATKRLEELLPGVIKNMKKIRGGWVKLFNKVREHSIGKDGKNERV